MPGVPPGGVILPNRPGTLPPETVTPPIAVLPPDGGTPLPPAGGGDIGPAARVGAIVAAEQVLTPKHGWNVWMDATYLDIADHRSDAQAKGVTSMLTFGADTIVRQGLIVGFTAGWQDAHTSLYEDAMRIESNGFNIGPYLAWVYSERWMLDVSLTYGQLDNSQRILVLSGDYDSTSLTGSIGTSGNYKWGETMVRPRVAVSYGMNWSDSFSLTGTLLGTPLDIVMKNDDYNTGTAMFSVEFSRIYFVGDRKPVMPYLNLEADWAFQHIGRGDALSGDLSETTTQTWTGSARAGVRILLSPATTITLSGGYTSIGQEGLDISEWRFYLSHSF